MSSVVDSQKICEWQQTVLSLLSNLKTRDAMYRVVQFSLRVVLAVRSICAASPHSAGLFARLVAAVAPKSAFDAKLMSAVAALATGRKVLAFGNVVSEVPNLHRLVSSLFSVSCFRFCCFFAFHNSLGMKHRNQQHWLQTRDGASCCAVTVHDQLLAL